MAVFFLAPFAAINARSRWVNLSRRAHLLTLAAGIVLGIHFIAWIESIYYTSVASASVLFTTNPLFIAILAFVVLGKRVDRSTEIAIVVAVGGAALIGFGDAGGGQFPQAILGNALATAAAICFAVYLLIGRVVRQSSEWFVYVFPLYTVVAITALVYAVIRDLPFFGFGWHVYAACALMALGPQIAGHGSLNYAVRYIPAAILGMLGLVEPALASIWAWLLFDEIPGPVTISGMVIVMGSLLSVYWIHRSAPS